MLRLCVSSLKHDPDFVDIAAEYERATGLTLTEFQSLIFGIHARFGQELARQIFLQPATLPLKDENFANAAITYEKVRRFLDLVSGNPVEMAAEIRASDKGSNDFTIFRKYPLVQQWYNLHLKTAWFGLLMMDNLFFLEKMQSGPYWEANATHGLKLRKFWGAVFEKYVNELLVHSITGTRSEFIPDPRYLDPPKNQVCDGLIVSGDSAVLMEYKSSMFRADSKYSGDWRTLAGEIERKLVYDKEAGQNKGVRQLAEASRGLFGSRPRRLAQDVDLTQVKKLYLCIITIDSIGGSIGISPFLDGFLHQELAPGELQGLDLRPLSCLDIEALEIITEHFGARSLPEILDEWYSVSPSLAAPLLMVDLGTPPVHRNEWLGQESDLVFKQIVATLFPEKDPEAALAEVRGGQVRPSRAGRANRRGQ
jgi:hypothetical protein